VSGGALFCKASHCTNAVSTAAQNACSFPLPAEYDRAVEEAKRRYERLCRVPLWSLYADRLELENEGQRTSYRPTPDEIALIPIPGRRKAVSDFAIGS